MAVEFYYPPGFHERIDTFSFFADVLGFNSEITAQDVVDLRNELLTWRRSSTNIFLPDSDKISSYDKAVIALGLCAKDIDVKLVKILEDEPNLRTNSKEEEYYLRRISVELAWVEAWHEMYYPQRKFISLKESVRALLGCTGKDHAKEYQRILCDNVGGLDCIYNGPNKWQLPLKFDGQYGEHEMVVAYSLDKDEPARLSDIEKFYCRKYAREVLEWDPSKAGTKKKKPYPKWMEA